MRTAIIALALGIAVTLPAIAEDRPQEVPFDSGWTMIAEGVFESVDECGTRHLRLEGEAGVLWKIAQYEQRFDALRDETGQIAEENLTEASILFKRVEGLYELVTVDNPKRAPSCYDQADIDSGTASCGDEDYTYYAYACGQYGEYLLSTPVADANASVSDCSGGWAAKAEAATYRDAATEESDYDSSGWGRTPSAYSSLSLVRSVSCGWAWARATVCFNCVKDEEPKSYYVYESEHDWPDECY